jgi:hypothetical protein
MQQKIIVMQIGITISFGQLSLNLTHRAAPQTDN